MGLCRYYLGEVNLPIAFPVSHLSCYLDLTLFINLVLFFVENSGIEEDY